MSGPESGGEPTLAETTARTLRMSRAVRAPGGDMAGENGQQLDSYGVGELAEYSELLAKVMRAQTGLLKEWRAQQKDQKRVVHNLPREQRLEVVVQWISKLPIDELEAHVEMVKRMLAERRKGGK